jgi:uncharacterized protein (TIGR03067 family)
VRNGILAEVPVIHRLEEFMRIRLFAALVAGLAVSAFAAAAQEKSDKELFQGTWTYESVEINGVKAQPEVTKQVQVRFVNDEVTIVDNDQVLGKGIQKLYPDKSPKQLEVSYTEGPNKGKTFIGIYKISSDSVTACFSSDDKTAPKDFVTAPGSDTRLVVLKRAKG